MKGGLANLGAAGVVVAGVNVPVMIPTGEIRLVHLRPTSTVKSIREEVSGLSGIPYRRIMFLGDRLPISNQFLLCALSKIAQTPDVCRLKVAIIPNGSYSQSTYGCK